MISSRSCREIVRRGERAWRFVFPNAPVRPVTINGGMSMRAWYDIAGLDRGAAEDVAGFRDSDALVAPTHREGGDPRNSGDTGWCSRVFRKAAR